MAAMKMYLNGQWVDRPRTMTVLNPFDQSVVDTVPRGTAADVDLAVTSAVRGAAVMAKLPAYERYSILRRAADLLSQRVEDLARTITLEEGKILAESRAEVGRAVQTITLSSEEAKRLHGETVPLDAAPGAVRQFGFTIRVPVGVVAAISPFNFPLNLVCHKVGPALAAGNAVVLKPAGNTPLSALKLTAILLEAGLPAEAIQCVTGPGGEIGDALTGDPPGAQDYLHRQR
jgi:glyceraldehyde-3-phosphate dehydrogenase (NADP+)